MMDDLVFPVFILEIDDHSFREVVEINGFDWYERPDIEDELYEGWDSSGRHFRLAWDKMQARSTIIFTDASSGRSFREAVNEYVLRMGDLKKRPGYLVDPDYIKSKVDNLGI